MRLLFEESIFSDMTNMLIYSYTFFPGFVVVIVFVTTLFCVYRDKKT